MEGECPSSPTAPSEDEQMANFEYATNEIMKIFQDPIF
jgi:hypothetical protein